MHDAIELSECFSRRLYSLRADATVVCSLATGIEKKGASKIHYLTLFQLKLGIDITRLYAMLSLVECFGSNLETGQSNRATCLTIDPSARGAGA